MPSWDNTISKNESTDAEISLLAPSTDNFLPVHSASFSTKATLLAHIQLHSIAPKGPRWGRGLQVAFIFPLLTLHPQPARQSWPSCVWSRNTFSLSHGRLAVPGSFKSVILSRYKSIGNFFIELKHLEMKRQQKVSRVRERGCTDYCNTKAPRYKWKLLTRKAL